MAAILDEVAQGENSENGRITPTRRSLSRTRQGLLLFFWGGELDLNRCNSGCARLSGEVGPPLGVAVEEVAILVV